MKLKPAPPALLLHTIPPPLTHKSLTQLQVETNLSLASSLLASLPHNKSFSFLKSQCYSIGFYAHQAASPGLVTTTHAFFPPIFNWDITKMLYSVEFTLISYQIFLHLVYFTSFLFLFCQFNFFFFFILYIKRDSINFEEGKAGIWIRALSFSILSGPLFPYI